MKQALVRMYSLDANPTATTDSQTVAKKFGMTHQEVFRMFERVLEDYPDLRQISNLSQTPSKTRTKIPPKSNPQQETLEQYALVDREYHGRPYKLIIMNKPMFTLLVMRFRTKRARECQRKFNAAFYEFEKQNIKLAANYKDDQWKLQREQSKLVHRNLTDAVKLFVDYATEQGSQNARTFYKHYQNAIYKALKLTEHNRPNLKETLDQMETWQLTTAESHAQQRLLVYMEQGEHYKVIYQLVKTDIEKLADTLMVPFNTYPPKIPSN